MAADDLHNLHTSSYEAGDDVHMYDFGNEGGTFEQTSEGGTWDEDGDAEVTEYFPKPPVAFEHGYTFLSLFDSDENSIYSKTNLHYPFSSWREWQLAAWLLRSGLSMGKINLFLALEMIRDLFYTMAHKLSQVYTEWMMGDHAWEMQSVLPHGATLLGTVLSSDKTCITALMGDCVAHPILLSLANIHMNTWLKSSSNTFVLTALLPVPKFIYKKKQMKDVLQDQLIHQCLDIESQNFCLNGVAKPFWSDWVLVDPDRFLTPELLHVIHKKFWDHDAQWLILAVGESEIDFQFSIPQPTTGYQHFHEGILKLKQVTDAAPSGIIVAVYALMHFYYLIQSPHINDHDICRISAALYKFHTNKHAIISAGVHQGKSHTIINNWYMPKLELMQSITPSIHSSGVMGQWSADVTEHAHITVVKDPTRSSNNNNYNPQICRHLDCADKCSWFKLATSLLDRKQNIKELQGVREEFANEDDETDSDVDDIPAGLSSTTRQPGQLHPTTNYFAIAKMLQQREMGSQQPHLLDWWSQKG
ncbi:hypothetical protein BDR06DRAFT_966821 [Suillus hirtellus]|nr:hypothetical protein BDR06DRAFT_966821 [Suillus hirtellus]